MCAPTLTNCFFGFMGSFLFLIIRVRVLPIMRHSESDTIFLSNDSSEQNYEQFYFLEPKTCRGISNLNEIQ